MAAIDKNNLQAELKKRRICRFCLCQDPHKLTNIYMRDTRVKSSAPLPIQIMAIASIEVFSNDEMPSYVCSDCTNMFEYSYQFKQMCKKADNLLRQFPLTGQWPATLQKPLLIETHSSQSTVASIVKCSKTTQVHIQQVPTTSIQQESLLLPKKILNTSANEKKPEVSHQSGWVAKMVPKTEKTNVDCTITFLDKIENNDELSLDDIHQLVAAEEVNDSEFFRMDNLPVRVVNSGNQTTKPKLLNKSSIRILNKNAEPENEPRLSLPKIKDVNGKMEIVAEILNVGEMPEGESDTSFATPIETNVYACNYCERTFPLLQLLDIHMKNHLRDRNFKCDYCDKSFLSKYDLQRHLFLHNGEKPYKCSVCDKAFSRSTTLSRHEMTHTDIPKYICIHCERSFLSLEDMEKHEKKHKIRRPFLCKICNKGFAFKQGVERHEVVHSRQQPYRCQYCNESFSTTTKLSRHLTAHAGRRPYPCKFCKKSYLLSHHLTRHLRSHRNVDDFTNAISFMCMRCNSSFKTRDELIRHSTTHANKKNLACPLCKDVFVNMGELTSHIQDHSDGEAYACEFCDLIFLTPEKLKAHIEPEHAQEMEAYHADDRAQAEREREEDTSEKSLLDITDDKFQTTVNEFLSDESPYVEHISENALKKNIKKEGEKLSPKTTNPLKTKSTKDGPNVKDQMDDDKSLLIPLKQRKIDLSDKKDVQISKIKQPSEESSLLKPKSSKVAGTLEGKGSRQRSSQSPKKSSESDIVLKKSIKTSTLITPSSNTSVAKKIMMTNALPKPKSIKIEKEPLDEQPPLASSDSLKTKKVQKITVTKAQAAAMAKQGRIKIKDGKIILKK